MCLIKLNHDGGGGGGHGLTRDPLVVIDVNNWIFQTCLYCSLLFYVFVVNNELLFAVLIARCNYSDVQHR